MINTLHSINRLIIVLEKRNHCNLGFLKGLLLQINLAVFQKVVTHIKYLEFFIVCPLICEIKVISLVSSAFSCSINYV